MHHFNMQGIQKKSYQAQKINCASTLDVKDWIINEAPLQININGKPFTVTMRTPGADNQLIKGLLYTENILQGNHPIEIIYTEDGDVAGVFIDPQHLGEGFSLNRSLLSVSSCGICGKRELGDLEMDDDALTINYKIDPKSIKDMFAIMEERQATFIQTGGAHAAACFDKRGELISIQEDIGRHNAVDKVVGDLLEKEMLDQARCLLVSGRISYEIVAKCYRGRIPLLAAVSSPSSLSIEISDKKGITLLGFCRGDTFTCYTHVDRLMNK